MRRIQDGRRTPTGARAGVLAVTAGLSLALLTGCGEHVDQALARGRAAVRQDDVDTHAPLTAAEQAWLRGEARISGLRRVGKIPDGFETTPANLRVVAAQLRSCRSQLRALGPATPRLEPVQRLLGRGCAEFDRGAGCLEAAASHGVPTSVEAVREVSDDVGCGFAAIQRAARPLADADLKAARVRERAGS